MRRARRRGQAARAEERGKKNDGGAYKPRGMGSFKAVDPRRLLRGLRRPRQGLSGRAGRRNHVPALGLAVIPGFRGPRPGRPAMRAGEINWRALATRAAPSPALVGFRGKKTSAPSDARPQGSARLLYKGCARGTGLTYLAYLKSDSRFRQGAEGGSTRGVVPQPGHGAPGRNHPANTSWPLPAAPRTVGLGPVVAASC